LTERATSVQVAALYDLETKSVKKIIDPKSDLDLGLKYRPFKGEGMLRMPRGDRPYPLTLIDIQELTAQASGKLNAR
jgi:hypothetical protein